jgi:hypothetical protein
VGYNVYRGTTSGRESSTPLNSTAINDTSYVDTKVTARMVYYCVVTSGGLKWRAKRPLERDGSRRANFLISLLFIRRSSLSHPFRDSWVVGAGSLRALGCGASRPCCSCIELTLPSRVGARG